jgi:hypothetical protein
MENEPKYDPPIYVHNKFGVIEHISDQCDNNTCTCKDRCQVDDMIFYESALLDDYKRNMREKQAKTVTSQNTRKASFLLNAYLKIVDFFKKK